jgi:protein-arginine kinase activator protein McsA
MQTLIFLLLAFLISIFSVLLYFKTKKSRLDLLNSGECPTCKQKTKTFFDKNTNTSFSSEIITSKVLKNHGCSGVVEIEYSCKNCGLKEVHQVPNSGCSL